MKHVLTVLMTFVISFVTTFGTVPAQTPELKKQERAIVAAWNECGVSIDKENALLQELTKSLQLQPPWRVVDAREPKKRGRLIDDIIAEHLKRIKLLETIKAEDLK